MNQTSHFARQFARRFALGGLLGALLAVAPAAAQTTAPAQPAPAAAQQIPASQIPVIVGIFDSGRVGNTSVAGKSLNDQVNAALKTLDTDFQKKQQALQQQMQQLVVARSANPPMAPADFEAKRKALYKQDSDLQAAYDKNKQALGARVEKARSKIAETMQKIVQDVAQQRKLTLVIERSAAHAFVPQWDITQEVMTRLNKALPSIKL